MNRDFEPITIHPSIRPRSGRPIDGNGDDGGGGGGATTRRPHRTDPTTATTTRPDDHTTTTTRPHVATAAAADASMVNYNFKAITPVPAATDFVDIVLSKTQRKTPTVVHKGYAIGRIRAFYLRKIKFAQQTYHDRLTQIITDFPVADEVHPFYGDLINVLYDRDHYKLALGQLNRARALIDNVGRDYVRLLKFSDSLYRAKSLKRAALGRMCTIMKRLGPSLAYLEQVRQHMARLPSIDPTTRTLLVAGFPNVGKSSFMNRVTRADVDVQPYAFTTKSLFVGHMDFQYMRWQVIDTPGVLDHELEQRNTIEMQSITALAHLRAAVLFFVDPSEHCGYPLEQQLSLFRALRPLFANKPLLMVCNKTDLEWESTLEPGRWAAIEETARAGRAELVKTSTLGGGDGVFDLRNMACEKLLEARVAHKVANKKSDRVLNRLHVATPTSTRPPVIPESVRRERQQQQQQHREAAAAAAAAAVDETMETTTATTTTTSARPRRRTEKDLEEEHGGAGVYSMDWRKLYDLRVPEWRYDIMPEIVDGKNVADFVDADILERLQALERDEEARLGVEHARMEDEDEEDDDADAAERREQLRRVRDARELRRAGAAREHSRRATVSKNQLARARSKSRARSVSISDADAGSSGARRSLSRPPSEAVVIRTGEGVRDAQHAKKARKLLERASRKLVGGRQHRVGEADRVITTKKPKHLYSGKSGIGKRDRR